MITPEPRVTWDRLALPSMQNVWYNLLAFILAGDFEAVREKRIREEVRCEMARSRHR